MSAPPSSSSVRASSRVAQNHEMQLAVAQSAAAAAAAAAAQAKHKLASSSAAAASSAGSRSSRSAFAPAPSATLISSNSDRIRVRTQSARPSYRDPTDREIAAETRRAERALDLAQQKRSAAEIEAEEAEDDIAMMQGEEDDNAAQAGSSASVRRSARAPRSKQPRDEDDEYADEADDAEEADEGEEEEEVEDAYDPAEARRHLSRGAKTAAREKVTATIHDAATSVRAANKGPSMLDQILSSIEALGLHKVKSGFTVAKIRNHMVSERGGGKAHDCPVGRFDTNRETKMFNTQFGKAWGKAIDLEFLVPAPDEDPAKVKWWRLNRGGVAAARKQEERAAAQAEKAKSKASAAAGAARRNSWGSDDGDVQVISSRRASQLVPTTIDPAKALFARLQDSISPFRLQIEQSQKRAAQAAAATLDGKRLPSTAAPSNGSRRSRRNNTEEEADAAVDISQDDERKEAAPSVPVSSLSALKVVPAADASAVKRENESKEQDDAAMEDVSAPASSSAAAAPEEKSQEVSAYLRANGPTLLRDFVLLSILESAGHKMTPKQIEAALERTPHLPRAFLHWAILSDVDAPSIKDEPAEAETMADEDEEESKRAPAPVEHVAQSPLEHCLDLLCSSGMLHKPASLRASADGAYRATAAALDSRKAVESTPIRIDRAASGEKRGGRGQRSSAQLAHAAEMRSLKLQFALKQNAFIEAHKDVFGPFITSKAERAKHSLPPLTLDASSSGRSDEADVHHKPYVFSGAIYPPPKSIHDAELMRPYQLKGMSFLAHLHDYGSGMILGDEMGLGKTLQTISFLAWLRENRGINGPHLVVVPLNVLDTWIGEVNRWCPSMRAVRYHGSEKERARIYKEYLQPGQFEILVTTFETVVVCEAFFKYHSFNFAYVIVDEAHRIKNESSLLSVALRHISSLNRLLLTGTPLQNNLHELWALVNYLYPTVFTESAPFDLGFDLNRNSVKPAILLAAQALLGPIMIRRLKREVATKLPPKTETIINVKLAPFQTHWYKCLLASASGLLDKLQMEALSSKDDAIAEGHANDDLEAGDAIVLAEKAQLDAEGNIVADQIAHLPPMDEAAANDDAAPAARKSAKKSKATKEDDDLGLNASLEVTASAGKDWRKLMNLLMQLRKVCNHPFLFPGAEPANSPRDAMITHSGKMQVLSKLLDKLYRRKHRVLIFSSFIGMLDILEDFCRLKKYKFLRLDGSSNRVQRKFDIARFNGSKEFFVYLISTRAGGLGINLATADTVIHYDSDWNPQVDLQAQDRAHRIGQTRPVRVFRLICEQSVEERVVARAQRKLYLSAMVSSGAAAGSELGLEANALEKLTKTQLLSMLKFGSDTVFKSEGTIDDRDIDAILAGAQTNLMSDEAIDARAATELKRQSSLESVKQDCASFDSSNVKDVGLMTFKGEQFSKGHFRDITHSWHVGSKRERSSTTIMIGEDAVLKSNNYELGSDLGRALEARDIRPCNVSYKPFAEHEQYCLHCHDGGVLYLCQLCPRALHAECCGYKPGTVLTGSFKCPQHSCDECDRSASDAGGMLFKCVSCPVTWCEDHCSKNLLALRNDPQLTKLGYHDRANAYYIVCGAPSCQAYYEEHVRIKEPTDGVDGELGQDAGPSLEDLLKSAQAGNGGSSEEAASPSDAAAIVAAQEHTMRMKAEAEETAAAAADSAAAPRKSPRAPTPKPAAAAAASSASAVAAAAASSPVPAEDEADYTGLSDRLRGRIKKLLQRESDACSEPAYKPNCLGDIPHIRQKLEFMRDDSTMLLAIHYMLYDDEPDVPSEARGRILAWTGLPVGTSKFAAGSFYERCRLEMRRWRVVSIEELSRILGLATQTPPSLISSGPLKGRMSHTEPRGFTIGKGDMDPVTGERGDPESCVVEHAICFLMAPRPSSQLLRFSYMQTSVLKDRTWAEEVRTAQETGIPRPKKIKPPKPVSAPPPSNASPQKKSSGAGASESPSASPLKRKTPSASTSLLGTKIASAAAASSSADASKPSKKPKSSSDEADSKSKKKDSASRKRSRSRSPTLAELAAKLAAKRARKEAKAAAAAAAATAVPVSVTLKSSPAKSLSATAYPSSAAALAQKQQAAQSATAAAAAAASSPSKAPKVLKPISSPTQAAAPAAAAGAKRGAPIPFTAAGQQATLKPVQPRAAASFFNRMAAATSAPAAASASSAAASAAATGAAKNKNGVELIEID